MRKRFPRHLGEPIGFYTKDNVIHPIFEPSGNDKRLKARIKEEEKKLEEESQESLLEEIERKILRGNGKEDSEKKLHETEIEQIQKEENRDKDTGIVAKKATNNET